MPNPIISKLLVIGTSFLFLVSSYAYTDRAISQMLMTSKPIFQNLIMFADWGDQHRYLLISIFLLSFFLIFLNQIFSQKKSLTTALIISLFFGFSYPIASRDIFSYLFAAKMVVQYHVSPYTVKPETFAQTDLWLGFTHWTNFTYAYPPFSLAYSLIPTIIFGTEKFLFLFFTYKILNIIIFCFTGYFLLKKFDQKLVYPLWFYNPFLIFEFLVNGHNDLLMVSLCLVSLAIFSWPLFLLSALTKLASIIMLPAILLKKSRSQILKIILFILLFFFSSKFRPIQPWYYSWIFMFLPFIKLKNTSQKIIYAFCFMILITYIPFLYSRQWVDSIPIFSFLVSNSIWFPLLLATSETFPSSRNENIQRN